MKFSKKRLLAAAAGAVTVGVVLTGCTGFGGGGSSGGGDAGSGTLTFTTWAGDSEATAFKSLVKQFESEHKGTTVKLNIVPYAQMYSDMDAKLAAGNAPDIFRVDYGNLGVYSSQDQLLDLSKYMNDEKSKFVPAMWEAVSYKGKPYGVPHQTDVSSLLVNKAMLTAAGIDVATLPKKQADAWTWQQFGDVAAKLRAALPAKQYPFVYNWQQAGAPRWLSWLFQANGALLKDDGKTPAIDSAAGAKALDFTKSFYEKKWVPPTSSPKSSVYADTTFQQGTAAMVFAGSFLVPDMASLAKFDWTAIPMPRDARGATDLGGNALVATKHTKNPALAAEFLKFMVQADTMSSYCAETNELPTRTDLGGDKITFKIRPDVMPVFVDQAGTITPGDVKQLTSPSMAAISTALQDQLDAAFVGGQSTKDTLAKLTTAIEEAAKK
ncbi:ABC transporter substrate-binding protein [Diaminobutyricibacter sp. McL0618]|uniref:ABC transporter substrate-binding protein n=1 Tax=Leifsonia sp. McL0618 TaxID=3415677 RepID=UPI003CECE700